MRRIIWLAGLVTLLVTPATQADGPIANLVVAHDLPDRQEYTGKSAGAFIGVNLEHHVITSLVVSRAFVSSQQSVARWTATCTGVAFRPGQIDTIGKQLYGNDEVDQKFRWFKRYLTTNRIPSLPGSRDYVF